MGTRGGEFSWWHLPLLLIPPLVATCGGGAMVSAESQFRIRHKNSGHCWQAKGLSLVKSLRACFWLVAMRVADNDYMGCVASVDRLALFFTASEVLLRKSLLPSSDKCLWKEEFGFHSAAPASADQAGAGPGSEFEVFCSTEFGFAEPVGGLWGRENVKINIMQPQIKSPRFINTLIHPPLSGNWAQLLRKCMNQIYFFGYFLWSHKISCFSFYQDKYSHCNKKVFGLYLIYFTFVARQKIFYTIHFPIFFVSGEHNW